MTLVKLVVLSSKFNVVYRESHFFISLIVIVGASPFGELRIYRSLINSIVF